MNEKQAIALLKKYSNNEKSFRAVLRHSKAVQKVALRIAKDIQKNNKIDLNFIKIACILHDIGRFKYYKKNSIKHGIAGAEILRKEKLERYAKVAERHLGAGISKQDIKKHKLDLPLKDFVPITIEEKVIAYSDNLVFGDKERTIQDVIERFRKEIGEDVVMKIVKLHEEIEWLRGNKFI